MIFSGTRVTPPVPVPNKGRHDRRSKDGQKQGQGQGEQSNQELHFGEAAVVTLSRSGAKTMKEVCSGKPPVLENGGTERGRPSHITTYNRQGRPCDLKC